MDNFKRTNFIFYEFYFYFFLSEFFSCRIISYQLLFSSFSTYFLHIHKTVLRNVQRSGLPCIWDERNRKRKGEWRRVWTTLPPFKLFSRGLVLVCYRSVPTLLLLSMPSMVKIPVDEEITGLWNAHSGREQTRTEKERNGGEREGGNWPIWNCYAWSFRNVVVTRL